MTGQTFRCYTEKSPDGQYYAVCLDLNLMDKRGTLDEAIAALDEDIVGYLASVREHGDATTAVPRPARRGEWLHFYQLSLRNVALILLGRRLDGFLAYTKKAPSGLMPAMRLAYAWEVPALDARRGDSHSQSARFCLSPCHGQPPILPGHDPRRSPPSDC